MIGWFVRTSVEETPNLVAVLAEQDRAAAAQEKSTAPPATPATEASTTKSSATEP